MAIDTQTKRRSVSGYSGIIIAPLADGTIGAADRAHVAGLYAVSASAPVRAYAALSFSLVSSSSLSFSLVSGAEGSVS